MLLALSLLGAATVASVVAYQRTAQRLPPAQERQARLLLEPEPEGPAEEKTLATLSVGDVIVDGDEDWLITGTLHCKEEQDLWRRHRVYSGNEEAWFDVYKDGTWQAAFMRTADDLPAFGSLMSGLTYRGMPFRLKRRGDCRVRREGDAAALAEVVQYTWYEGPGGHRLYVEESAGTRQAFTGARVLEDGLSLMEGRPDDDDELFTG